MVLTLGSQSLVPVGYSRYDVPMYISETGQKVQENKREPENWIKKTMKVNLDKRDQDLDIRGYYFWTLMDNYEWNHGLNMKFGLYGYAPKD